MGKCLEEVLLNRMKDDEVEVKGVPSNQFAYRPRHSAAHAVDLLCEESSAKRSVGKSTAVVSLDVTKAFDSVWKKGLIYMMKAGGVHMNTLAMINSFMSNRTAVVMLGDTRSEEFPIKRGVPQGSKLGPTLYSIYTKDFGIEYNEEQGMAKYADDLLYWCSGKYKPRIVKNVKNGFQKIKEEMEKWGI